MKAANAPMTLADVEALLCLAAEISNHRRFVVAGSLVAHRCDGPSARRDDRNNAFYAKSIAPTRLTLPSA